MSRLLTALGKKYMSKGASKVASDVVETEVKQSPITELLAERLSRNPQAQKTFSPKLDTPSDKFKNPIYLEGGDRISGFNSTNRGKDSVFYGYTKNNESFTTRLDKLDPNRVVSQVEKGRASESEINSFKEFIIKNKPDEAFDSTNLPPASNAQRTQITTTKGTYKKAAAILKVEKGATDSKSLDFGAGRGHSADYGFDTYEPFPREGFTPTYNDPSKIPASSYDKITNLNVLNVVPPSIRDGIVKDIGRILKPGGDAIITARSYADVMATKNKTPVGEKGTAFITGTETYQKGFKPGELLKYVKGILGKDYEIKPISLGATGIKIKKLNE